MSKIKIHTISKKIGGDLLTPVGIYLKTRDQFREPLLLESSDHRTGRNSSSYICLEPLTGIAVYADSVVVTEKRAQKLPLTGDLYGTITDFMHRFEAPHAQLFGYVAYNAVTLMEEIELSRQSPETDIPLAKYSLYRYVIEVNHFNDEVKITCHADKEEELSSQMARIEDILLTQGIAEFEFSLRGEETSDSTEEEYLEMVEKAKQHCRRGDVFQLVLSRRFSQKFIGDEFNVYRQLRRINPSPYLFYFDHGNFKLFGSSPEAQLVVESGKAEIHPIAGTYKRTENESDDLKAIGQLLEDKKENAEHMMLVDLARNDLSRHCSEVKVETLKEVQLYSHVIHLVSKVSGRLKESGSAFKVLSDSFPAGTLSGAPKHKAMQLIDLYERSARGFYGGAVGFIGFDGSLNHAIMIRSFMSRNNTLYFRAGAGIVDSSIGESELNEVYNKTGALRKAMQLAANKITKQQKEAV